MIVFLVIALITAVLNTLLIAVDFLGLAIAYGLAGLLCGLVLRTRIEGGVGRVLLVCFYTLGFAAGGVWTGLTMVAQASLADVAGMNVLAWGVVGFAASTPYLGTRLTPPLIALACFGAAGGLTVVLVDVLIEFGDLFINPMLVCLAAGVLDQICERIGLESKESGFDRLRIRLEFRLR